MRINTPLAPVEYIQAAIKNGVTRPPLRCRWLRGLLKSDSSQGRVRFGLPQHALRFLFPQLWPEAEADSANQ